MVQKIILICVCLAGAYFMVQGLLPNHVSHCIELEVFNWQLWGGLTSFILTGLFLLWNEVADYLKRKTI